MVGGGAGGGRGGGRGGQGGRGGGGGDDEEARRALIRSCGARKHAARSYLVQGGRVPLALADYAPGGRYYNHLSPQGRGAGGHGAPAGIVLGAQPPPAAVHEHLFTHDDAEEAAYIAQATAESEASIAAWKRREDEELEAQMAVFRAREHAAKRARIDGAGPSCAVDSDDSE